MKEAKIKVGDVVYLKSGSVQMTVSKIKIRGGFAKAKTSWMASDGRWLENVWFAIEQLSTDRHLETR